MIKKKLLKDIKNKLKKVVIKKKKNHEVKMASIVKGKC